MTLVAGVDIGNATTEIVISDTDTAPPRPVLWDRAVTSGVKGSAESARRAALLLLRMERRLGSRCDEVIMTPQTPVLTQRIDVPADLVDTGDFTLVALGSSTPAGVGVGVGHPVDITHDPCDTPVEHGPVILIACDPLGYRTTVAQIIGWVSAGHDVSGLLLAGDEARLVESRLPQALPNIPIMDSVDAHLALRCDLIALEVATAGQQVRTLGDPIWLASALSTRMGLHAHALAICALTRGHRSAAIGLMPEARRSVASVTQSATVHLTDGSRCQFADALQQLAVLPVGSAHGYAIPPAAEVAVDDLWIVDLATLGALAGLRSGTVHTDRLVVAALAAQDSPTDQAAAFSDGWGGAVAMRSTESRAARLGALTTPGASPHALVVDLGGGTIDVIPSGEGAITAAGSGDLLTAAVAHALSISSGAAEWAKRGPASRVESPQLVTDESGERRFLDSPAPHGTVGWLISPGPSGPLPFSRILTVAEWRQIRMTLKQMVFSSNLSRVRQHLSDSTTSAAGDVIVVGGPAGDDEILEILGGHSPRSAFGRANVAGLLGHRWAVAYGLTMTDPDEPRSAASA